MSKSISKDSKKFDWFKVIPIGIALCYVMGFIVWNLYLSLFGYFEYNFLQTRFLSGGAAAIMIIGTLDVLIIGLMYFLFAKPFNFLKSKCRLFFKFENQLYLYFISVLVVSSFLFYAAFIFPLLPQYLGGARPVVASLLSDPEGIEYLNNFNIRSAPNADLKKSVQTLPICILYQSDKYLFLGVQYTQGGQSVIRNLLIKTDKIEGLQYGLLNELRCNPWDFYVGLKSQNGNQIYNVDSGGLSEYSCK